MHFKMDAILGLEYQLVYLKSGVFWNFTTLQSCKEWTPSTTSNQTKTMADNTQHAPWHPDIFLFSVTQLGHGILCIHLVALSQDQISIFCFLTHHITSQWPTPQYQHYTSMGTTKSAWAWACQPCTQFLRCSSSMGLQINKQAHHLWQELDLCFMADAVQDQFAWDLLAADSILRSAQIHPPKLHFDQILCLPTDDLRLWLTALLNARHRAREQLQSLLGQCSRHCNWLTTTTDDELWSAIKSRFYIRHVVLSHWIEKKPPF